MNIPRLHPVFAIALLTASVAGGVTACASQAETGDVEGHEGHEGHEVAAATPKSHGTALRLEEAERDLDIGRDVPAARATLDAVLADPTSTIEQRDQARLAQSRALESSGDKEGAIAAVEGLLAAHPEATHFPAEEAAEARLRKLLTGSEVDPARRPEDTRQASSFARALAAYFPTTSSSKVPIEVRLVAFGGNEEASDHFGTFAVGRAIGELRREACPLCDGGVSTRSSSGRRGSWIGIPRERGRLANAIGVFYFDLEGGRIPARYDADLPLPSADIASRLERGSEGLIVVRERKGAPPLILIAAPREAQLSEVEEALSVMKTIPTEPVSVPLKSALTPGEIQSVVRGSFSLYRACYTARLKAEPAAHGRSRLHFSIRGDGSIEGLTVDSDTTLETPDFDACMLAATRTLSFPATHAAKPTTVTYPILFAPGD